MFSKSDVAQATTSPGAIGCRCWGIDPSRQMLAKARAQSRSICFMLGRAEQLNLPQGFFDLVFCVDVIHHLTDCAAYFREAYRVLKPGGKVCTVTESRDLIRNRSLHSVYFPETVEIDLARYPRMADLREWMECADFVNIAEEETAFAYRRYDMQAFRDKAFSVLHRISEEAFRRGIARMEQDLRADPIPCVWRYVLLWGTKLRR
jgi:ubiquinone/menaquinone biosynthesis C-methylase UbiE